MFKPSHSWKERTSLTNAPISEQFEEPVTLLKIENTEPTGSFLVVSL